MPKKQNKISVVIHIPNDAKLCDLNETLNGLFAYTVKKYLDSLDVSEGEKRKIITDLIYKLNI